MAIFHVPVRKYHWSKRNVVVQSPILDLRTTAPTIIIRPLQGIHKDEPRTVEKPTELKDDIHDKPDETEAHGIYVSADSSTGHFPIWVPVQDTPTQSHTQHETRAVNLKTFEDLIIPISRVAWTPELEAENGSVCTVIGAPRRMGNQESVVVILQDLGAPTATNFSHLSPAALSKYRPLGVVDKQAIFDWRLVSIRQNRTGKSPMMAGLLQLAIGSRQYGHRRPLREILDGDTDWLPDTPARDHYSDSWKENPLSQSPRIIDENWRRDESFNVQAAEVSGRLYACRCTFSNLGPTYLDISPRHRHVSDSECPLGSAHSSHCIFALHSPDFCVLCGSREDHDHCPLADASPTARAPCCSTTKESPDIHMQSVSQDALSLTEDAQRDAEDSRESHVGGIDDELLGLEDIAGTDDNMTLDASHLQTFSLPPPSLSPISACLDAVFPGQEDMESTYLDPLSEPALEANDADVPLWRPRGDWDALRSPKPQDLLL
ncbi:hypothetical protein F4778DRAFT_276247 [Xylariomycetidae sp. FL2044]|nr:hypothetical protein F4778DRAFT_276247 [Xylariomycetidae sp. FL2044]